MVKRGRQNTAGQPPKLQSTQQEVNRAMLNFFNSFVVPGVDNVTIYHDDQDPRQFYMLPEFPTIKTGPDGGPMFNLVIFARDFHLMKDAAQGLPATETEGGLLGMTTELSVSQENQVKILQYIQNDMRKDAQRNIRPIFRGPGKVLIEPLMAFTPVQPPRLSYPIWVEPPDSAVTFCIVPAGGETFIKATAGSNKPSLIAENIANYSVLLGQEGVELVRSVVDQGSVIGNVNYTVSFVARIPSLSIHIYGDASNIYNEIKDYCQVHENYSYDGKNWHYSYPAVSSLNELKTISAHLHVDIDAGDFHQAVAGSDPSAAQAVEQQVQTLALNIAQTYLQNVFFAPPFSAGLDPAKLGTDPLAHDPNADKSKGAQPPNQLWLKTFTQSMQGSFDFKIDFRSNFTVTKYPNSMLTTMVSADAIKKRLITADLSHPYFQNLGVSVRVTADFEKDPIAAIKVLVNYKQIDEPTGQVRTETQTFTFTTGQEVFFFQAVMAKDQSGVPKDTYTYSSEIIYKASSQTEKIPPQQTNERSLVLGYNELSCVRVQATWGAVPADTINRVQVHFKYPGLNSSTAESDVFLSAEHPDATWFTYTGGNASSAYQYQLSYFLVSGQRLDLPVQTGLSGTLVVNAPFEDMLRITFVPQGSFPPVSSIVVTARYTDADNDYNQQDVHMFTNLTDTWSWQVRLRDKRKRDFQYKVDVTYADGSADQGEFQPGTEGTILVGKVAKQILEVSVVPTLLDLQQTWKLVIVRLKYQDPDNQVDLSENLMITAANAGQPLTWNVPLKNAALKKYTYQIEAFAFDATKNKVVAPTVTDDPLLVLQL
jgi:hypothetical protein